MTGEPSSGRVYWLFSVVLEPSSVPVPPPDSVVSVGAGRGGPLRSTPIVATQRSTEKSRECMRSNMVVAATGCVQSSEEAGEM